MLQSSLYADLIPVYFDQWSGNKHHANIATFHEWQCGERLHVSYRELHRKKQTKKISSQLQRNTKSFARSMIVIQGCDSIQGVSRRLSFFSFSFSIPSIGICTQDALSLHVSHVHSKKVKPEESFQLQFGLIQDWDIPGQHEILPYLVYWPHKDIYHCGKRQEVAQT